MTDRSWTESISTVGLDCDSVIDECRLQEITNFTKGTLLELTLAAGRQVKQNSSQKGLKQSTTNTKAVNLM